MKKLILVLGMLLPGVTFAGDAGNGGDVVKCEDSSGKEKLFFLDSAFSKYERPDNKLVFNSTEEFIKEFTGKLARTFPYLSKEFEEFYKIFKTKGDIKKGWRRGIPIDIKDENLFTKFPPNCKAETAEQAVIRHVEYRYTKEVSEDQISGVQYFYNESIINQLSKHNDELSWALVHEWLWDHLNNALKIRLINEYFHSEKFFQASEDQIYDTLNNFGFREGDFSRFGTMEKNRLEYEKSKEEILNAALEFNKLKEIVTKYYNNKELYRVTKPQARKYFYQLAYNVQLYDVYGYKMWSGDAFEQKYKGMNNLLSKSISKKDYERIKKVVRVKHRFGYDFFQYYYKIEPKSRYSKDYKILTDVEYY